MEQVPPQQPQQQEPPQQPQQIPKSTEAFLAFEEARLRREALRRRCLLGFLRMPS